MNIAIIVHGGAHAIDAADIDAHKNGCLEAAWAGWSVLQNGGRAVDAVEAAIKVLEDDATFNAGYGSELNAAGEVEMDSAVMDGRDLSAGGVGALKGVRHPIAVARRVLDEQPVLLVADGARCFARDCGIALCDPQEMVSDKQRDKWERRQREGSPGASDGHDTVGCVALDTEGNLAAGTSTGGTNENAPGRIGDSPIIGCGLYADNQTGACALTGDGESIVRVVLAKTTLDLLREDAPPDVAVQQAMEILQKRVGGEGGCILIDRQGRIGWGHNAANLSCAYFSTGMTEPVAFVHKTEEKEME
ncbi:MAG: L-asparaginase / beta-aspartyl-peptidase [Abditibacteriota bacterium]|nr:L-asparaginase / beta-aspartyl-peptidase [Abditibacteriota bacterium]